MDMNQWLVAAVGTVVVLAVIWLLVAAIAGTALASWGDFPVWVGILVCALVPVVGPVVLVVVGVVRSTRAEYRPTWVDRGRWTVRGIPIAGRRIRLGLLVVGLLALAALFVVPVARLHAGAQFSTPILLTGLPVGGGLLAVTFAVALLVAALAARRTTRLGAVVGAAVGGSWAALSATVLLLSVPLTGVLHLADRYVGNALAGAVLSLLRSYEVPAAAVASEVRESVSTRLDIGVWVALAGGVLLLGWAFAEVVSGHRAALRDRRGEGVRTIAPGTGTSTAVVPPPDVWSF